MQRLYQRLMSDLKSIGMPTDFELELRPYSKTYFGRFDPNTDKIVIYVYKDKAKTQLFEYEELMTTLVHETVHCIQWHDKNFVRLKGVMHNAEFYQLFNKYMDRAKAHLLLQEVKNDTISKKYINEPFKICG